MSLLANYPNLLLRQEVADELRVSTKTLSRWAAEGTGPRCLRLDEGVLRYRKEDVITFLEGC